MHKKEMKCWQAGNRREATTDARLIVSEIGHPACENEVKLIRTGWACQFKNRKEIDMDSLKPVL